MGVTGVFIGLVTSRVLVLSECVAHVFLIGSLVDSMCSLACRTDCLHGLETPLPCSVVLAGAPFPPQQALFVKQDSAASWRVAVLFAVYTQQFTLHSATPQLRMFGALVTGAISSPQSCFRQVALIRLQKAVDVLLRLLLSRGVI